MANFRDFLEKNTIFNEHPVDNTIVFFTLNVDGKAGDPALSPPPPVSDF